MQIHVTQEDIDAGQACRGASCPIALALRRASRARRTTLVSVNPWSATIGIRGRRWADLPDEAAQFVIQFDKGFTVAPFTFDLPI